MCNKSNSWSAITLRFLGLSLLVFATSVTAAGAPYGQYFMRAGHSWPDAGPGVPQAAALPSPPIADQAAYRSAVAASEQAGGAYADSLAESLAALAQQQRLQGNLEEAQRLYRRALHVVRVNDGLYSQRQRPLLRELLQTYRMAGDYAALDGRYDYYFRLYGSGRAPYTEIRLAAALEYLRWQREALRRELDGRGLDRLLAAHKLNRELLQGVAAAVDVSFEQRRELTLSQLRNLYLLLDRLPAEPSRQDTLAAADYLASRPMEQSLNQQRLENLRRAAPAAGEDLLQALQPLARREGPAAEAALYLELGDWLQWQGKDRNAREAYAEVERLLTAAGQPELLRRWLDEPVELPANGAFWQPVAVSGENGSGVLTVRFDVSARGRVSHIENETVAPEQKAEAAGLRRHLVKTRFRPRWQGGEPRPVTRLQRDYQLTR